MGVVLIDAMSSFDCKASLHLDVLNDNWFHDSAEMFFFNLEFQDDTSKFYNLIDSKNGSFIALQTPTIRCENCYLFKVISKNVADDYVTDSHGHTIGKEEPYFIGSSFEKSGKEMITHIVSSNLKALQMLLFIPIKCLRLMFISIASLLVSVSTSHSVQNCIDFKNL